jgi:hypothetical protein
MQGEHADLVIFTAVARHLTAAGKEDEVVGAVPLLDDVQAFVDLAAEVCVPKTLSELLT